MAKKRPAKKNGSKKSDRQYQRATRNVQLQNQPNIDSLNAQMQQAQQDFQRSSGRGASITGGYEDTLAGLPQTDYGSMADDFTQRLGGISDMFGGQAGMNPNEISAGQGVGSTLGQGALANLSQFGAREGAARESAGREGALSGRYLQENLMKGFQDTLQGYNNQLSNINAKVPSQIDMEQDQLRQQGIENQLAQSKMASDEAFSQYLQDQLGNLTSNNGPPGNPNPNNGPNNGNGNGNNGPGPNTGPGTGPYGTGQNGPNPHDYHQGPTAQIPAAWQRADSFGELPGLVKHAYQRPKGTSLEEAFNSNAHPSFNNFNNFQEAYQDFIRQITQLYNSRDNGAMTDTLGGGYHGR